jgi:hypothetical protein
LDPALGGAQAVIFGGGIAENTLLVRRTVCDGLQWCGLEMDENRNRSLIDIEGRLSNERSAIQAWVLPSKRACRLPMSAPRQSAEKITPNRKKSSQPAAVFLHLSRAVHCLEILTATLGSIYELVKLPGNNPFQPGPAMTDAVRTSPQIESPAAQIRALSGETNQ